MFFVKKWLKPKKKVPLPEKHWKSKFWDRKNVMTGKDLCSFRGHEWEVIGEPHLGRCKRCGELALK